MKISGINLDIRWKNKSLNFEYIEDISKNIDADILLLPEMFSTGFCMDAEEIADQNNESLHWMIAFAEKKNVAVCGSVSVKENGRFFNRMYFVKPDGTFQWYNKRHLFSYSGEDKNYASGNERVVVEYKGWKMLLQICYDLRFPVFARNKNDYDGILYIANWPKSRGEVWKHLLKARALENQSYVFGLNRIGTDGNNLEYEESSFCFAPDGNDITEKQNHVVSAILDKNYLEKYRKKFPFLSDADDFEIL